MSCRHEWPGHEFTPVVVLERKFHTGFMSMQNDHLFRCEISLQVDWNGSSAYIMFAILNCTCNKFINMRSTFRWPRYERTHHYVKAIRNQTVTPVWNSCRWKFSYVNSPLVCLTVHRLSNYPDLIGILLILLEYPKSLPICNQHRKNVTYSRGWTVWVYIRPLGIPYSWTLPDNFFFCANKENVYMLIFSPFPLHLSTQKRQRFSRCYEKMEDERSACITWSNKDT